MWKQSEALLTHIAVVLRLCFLQLFLFKARPFAIVDHMINFLSTRKQFAFEKILLGGTESNLEVFNCVSRK